MNPVLIGVPAVAALTSGAIGYAAVHQRSQLFGATIRSTGAPQQLALTFDDGPNDPHTLRLMEVLEKDSVRATFFLIVSRNAM